MNRIMVCAGGNPLDEQAMQIACQLALKQGSGRSQIYVVHVLEVSRSKPLSSLSDQEISQADQILERLEQLAAENQVSAETEIVQAREIGPALVCEAQDWGAEVMILGVPYKRRFGDLNLGKTATHLLKNASCQLILLREKPTK